MVAYALYKQAKRDWARHNPSETDRSAFHRAITDTQIRMFRSLAEQMMAAYADTVINEAKPSIESAARSSALVAEVTKLNGQMAETLRDSSQDLLREVTRQNSFWTNAWASIVGSVLFAVFLFLVGVAFFSPGIKTFLDAASTAAPPPTSPRVPAGSTGAAP